MKLSEGIVGKSYIVKALNLDLKSKRRLEILGMTVNAAISVLNSKSSGTKIIKVRGTRFAIGREFADNIIVELACNKEGGM